MQQAEAEESRKLIMPVPVISLDATQQVLRPMANMHIFVQLDYRQRIIFTIVSLQKQNYSREFEAHHVKKER